MRITTNGPEFLVLSRSSTPPQSERGERKRERERERERARENERERERERKILLANDT